MHFNPKTWPWWAWTVVSLIVLCLILISVALAIRQQGINDLRQEIAALRAAGRPAMLEDVYPRLRTLDPGRQARAWDLFGDKSPAIWNHDLSTYGMMGRYGSIQKGGFDPKKIASLSAQVLLDSAIVRSTWRTLWHEGSVELNTLAWLFLNHPDSETISFNDPHFNFHVSSLMAIRNVANALATAARLADDPLPDLRDLDALVTAQRPWGSLIDAMMSTSMESIQDSAWLEASLRGVDSSEWITSVPDRFALMIEGWAHERVISCDTAANDVFKGGDWNIISQLDEEFFFPTSSTYPWYNSFRDWGSRHVAWVTHAHDISMMMKHSALAEEFLKTGHDSTSTITNQFNSEWFCFFHPVAKLALSNGMEVNRTIAQSAISGKISRAAAVLAHHWIHSGTLPETITSTDFPAAALPLMAATPLLPPILYTRISPTRFRLWVDPSNPPTDLIPWQNRHQTSGTHDTIF